MLIALFGQFMQLIQDGCEVLCQGALQSRVIGLRVRGRRVAAQSALVLLRGYQRFDFGLALVAFGGLADVILVDPQPCGARDFATFIGCGLWLLLCGHHFRPSLHARMWLWRIEL